MLCLKLFIYIYIIIYNAISVSLLALITNTSDMFPIIYNKQLLRYVTFFIFLKLGVASLKVLFYANKNILMHLLLIGRFHCGRTPIDIQCYGINRGYLKAINI